jgi:hypothetical protein
MFPVGRGTRAVNQWNGLRSTEDYHRTTSQRSVMLPIRQQVRRRTVKSVQVLRCRNDFRQKSLKRRGSTYTKNRTDTDNFPA